MTPLLKFTFFKSDAPQSLRDFLTAMNLLKLDRNTQHTEAESDKSYPSSEGMSPKKSHEVARLSSLIRQVSTNGSFAEPLAEHHHTRHVVDAGAGQGYISRELAFSSYQSAEAKHVLALEYDDIQLEGAKRRDDVQDQATTKAGGDLADSSRGSITYRKVWVSTGSLVPEVEGWVRDLDTKPETASPVMFTGLHACGSLTPAVLRSFVDLTRSHPKSESGVWFPSSLVLVGCCYTLLAPDGELKSLYSQ